jgi:hypothetical protein
MMRGWLLLPVFLLCAWGQHEPPPAVGTAVPQPLPFRHQAHVAVALKCVECHATAGQSRAAGMPAEALCMKCHIAVKADAPAIRMLADYQKRGEAIPWARVYRLPNFVAFSHRRHFSKAGIACAECHGDVAGWEVPAKEKPIGMQACMHCHDQRKANNNCDACHAVHPA